MTKQIQQLPPPMRNTASQKDELLIFQMLASQGLIDEIPEKGDEPIPDFTPLPAKGKPTSEYIIEDRGER
jgi:hypothetical protein